MEEQERRKQNRKIAQYHQHIQKEKHTSPGLFSEMKARTLLARNAWKRMGSKEHQLTRAFVKEMEETRGALARMAAGHRDVAEQEGGSLREDAWIRQNSAIVRDPFAKVDQLQLEVQSLEPIQLTETWDVQTSNVFGILLDPGAEDDNQEEMDNDNLRSILAEMIKSAQDVLKENTVLENLQSTGDYIIRWQESIKISDFLEFISSQHMPFDEFEDGEGNVGLASSTKRGIFLYEVRVVWMLPEPADNEDQRFNIINTTPKVVAKFTSTVKNKIKQEFSITLSSKPGLKEYSETTCRIFEPQAPADVGMLDRDSTTHTQRVAVRCNRKDSTIESNDVIQRIFALQLGTAKLFWQEKEQRFHEPLPLLTEVPKSCRCWLEYDKERQRLRAKVKTVATFRKSADEEGGGGGKKQTKNTQKLLITTEYELHEVLHFRQSPQQQKDPASASEGAQVDQQHEKQQQQQEENEDAATNAFGEIGPQGGYTFAPIGGGGNGRMMMGVVPTMMMMPSPQFLSVQQPRMVTPTMMMRPIMMPMAAPQPPPNPQLPVATGNMVPFIPPHRYQRFLKGYRKVSKHFHSFLDSSGFKKASSAMVKAISKARLLPMLEKRKKEEQYAKLELDDTAGSRRAKELADKLAQAEEVVRPRFVVLTDMNNHFHFILTNFCSAG